MKGSILCGALALLTIACPQTGWSLPPDHCGNTPLVVDVKGDGIKLGPAGVGVRFDLNGTGIPIHMQWTRADGDEAFLVADLNGNGVVDNGSELFGQGTILVLSGERARNGFVALQQYDTAALGGNEDGFITSADTIWTMLRLWTDKNADGRTQRGEMRAVSAQGLASFNTFPKFAPYYDEAGNHVPVYSWATRARKQVKVVDVFFRGLPG